VYRVLASQGWLQNSTVLKNCTGAQYLKHGIHEWDSIITNTQIIARAVNVPKSLIIVQSCIVMESVIRRHVMGSPTVKGLRPLALDVKLRLEGINMQICRGVRTIIVPLCHVTRTIVSTNILHTYL
jgi:hypothetical protein